MEVSREHAKEVALPHDSDIANSDVIIQSGRIRHPQSVAMIKRCELVPIGVVVSHDKERKRRGTAR